jgi:hypothetical protein
VVVAVVTLGVGLLIVHPLCAVWGALAAQSYNKRQFASVANASAAPPPAGVPAMYRECPHCKEQMRRDASVCPHCRMSSPAWTLNDGVWWFKSAEGWYWLDEPNGEWLRPKAPALEPGRESEPDPITTSSPNE